MILTGPQQKIETLELRLIEFESDKVDRGEVLEAREDEYKEPAGGEEEEGEAVGGRLSDLKRGQRVKLIRADAARAGLCLEIQRERRIFPEGKKKTKKKHATKSLRSPR